MSDRTPISLPPPVHVSARREEEPSSGADQAARLTDVLRRRTHRLHIEAERSGIVREILRGRASRFGYALFLRNLMPAYEALERGLERHRRGPCLGRLALPEVYRREALSADLVGLCGRDWGRLLPLLPAGEAYARRVAESAGADGPRLLAHAYVRYLGDLNGGQTLRKLLAASLGLGPGALAFYSFPWIADLAAFKVRYRQILDSAIDDADAIEAAAQEAERAFRLNISVSEAVVAAAGRCLEADSPSRPAAS